MALAGVMILLVGLINTILGIAAIDKRVLPRGGLLASRVGRVWSGRGPVEPSNSPCLPPAAVIGWR